MSAPTPRYMVEVFLVDGREIRQPISDENADAHMRSRAFMWRPGMTEDQKRESAIFTIFLAAMDKGTGFVSVTDETGRTWAVRASNIAYFNLRDVQGTTGGIPPAMGFQPPTVEIRAS